MKIRNLSIEKGLIIETLKEEDNKELCFKGKKELVIALLQQLKNPSSFFMINKTERGYK